MVSSDPIRPSGSSDPLRNSSSAPKSSIRQIFKSCFHSMASHFPSKGNISSQSPQSSKSRSFIGFFSKLFSSSKTNAKQEMYTPQEQKISKFFEDFNKSEVGRKISKGSSLQGIDIEEIINKLNSDLLKTDNLDLLLNKLASAQDGKPSIILIRVLQQVSKKDILDTTNLKKKLGTNDAQEILIRELTNGIKSTPSKVEGKSMINQEELFDKEKLFDKFDEFFEEHSKSNFDKPFDKPIMNLLINNSSTLLRNMDLSKGSVDSQLTGMLEEHKNKPSSILLKALIRGVENRYINKDKSILIDAYINKYNKILEEEINNFRSNSF